MKTETNKLMDELKRNLPLYKNPSIHDDCREGLKEQKQRLSISIKAAIESKTVALKNHKPWFTVQVFHKAVPTEILYNEQFQTCCAYEAKRKALACYENAIAENQPEDYEPSCESFYRN